MSPRMASDKVVCDSAFQKSWILHIRISPCFSCVFVLITFIISQFGASIAKSEFELPFLALIHLELGGGLLLPPPPLAFQRQRSLAQSLTHPRLAHHQSFDSNMSSVKERACKRFDEGGGGKFTGCDTKLFFEGFCDRREPSSVPHGAT